MQNSDSAVDEFQLTTKGCFPRYNNKTSYYFDRELGTCKEMDFPVGILTPDWLANAAYLGTDTVDTYETHVWTKAKGFIKYWADTKTGLPVSPPLSCSGAAFLHQDMAHMCAFAIDLLSGRIEHGVISVPYASAVFAEQSG